MVAAQFRERICGENELVLVGLTRIAGYQLFDLEVGDLECIQNFVAIVPPQIPPLRRTLGFGQSNLEIDTSETLDEAPPYGQRGSTREGGWASPYIGQRSIGAGACDKGRIRAGGKRGDSEFGNICE
jgi:hypothetical protein